MYLDKQNNENSIIAWQQSNSIPTQYFDFSGTIQISNHSIAYRQSDDATIQAHLLNTRQKFWH